MKTGDRYLVTTNDWFFAPDGENYKAVFGTVHGVDDAETVLGIRTNHRSTNWYLRIGDMIVAGCQIFYAVRCDAVNLGPPTLEMIHETHLATAPASNSRVYDADRSGLTANDDATEEPRRP